MDFQAITHDFAVRVIEAYSAKSVAACFDLLPTRAEDKRIAKVIPFRFGHHRAKKFVKEQLKEDARWIDRLNAHPDTALVSSRLDEVLVRDFVFDPSAPIQVIPQIWIRMHRHVSDGRIRRAIIGVKDAVLIDGVIRNSHFLNVSYREPSKRDPQAPTRFTGIYDQDALREMLLPLIGSEWAGHMTDDYEWEMHEGDLELDTFDVNVNLIVTGNLTVREPLMEPNVSLIVVGKTTVNALALMDADNAFLLGGVDFAVALFSCMAGPMKVVKQPSGPFLYTDSDSTEFTGESGADCFLDYSLGNSHGDLRATIRDEFLMTHDDGDTDIKINMMFEAIKSGRSILR